MGLAELIAGLAARGFENVDGICSMGKCRLGKHFILLTDGLVIYSNLPFWMDCAGSSDGLAQTWVLNESNAKPDAFLPGKVFAFDELDKILN